MLENKPLDGRAAAGLDSIANNAAPSDLAKPKNDFWDEFNRKRRYVGEKYQQRMYLRRLLHGTRCASCGRVVNKSAGVGLYWSVEHQARFSGLQTCGSVWCCPICNAKIQARRYQELKTMLEWARDNGYSVVFATHTVRHDRTQSLEQVRDMAATIWRKCRSHQPVKKLFKRYGSKGYVRAQEVTFSDANGWHVHYHGYYILRGKLTQSEVDSFGAAYAANWIKTAADNGYSAPTEENQRFELVQLGNEADLTKAAQYVTMTKTADLRSAAAELTDTQSKFGKVIEHNDGTTNLHMNYWDMLRAYTDIKRTAAARKKNGRTSVKTVSTSSYIIGVSGMVDFQGKRSPDHTFLT